jgi:hypothetical protein
MTLPDERYRAVMLAKKLLHDIAYNTKETPRVPKSIRARASSVLHHYPGEWDMMAAAQDAPHVFQQQIEPVYRLILEHENNKKSESNFE